MSFIMSNSQTWGKRHSMMVRTTKKAARCRKLAISMKNPGQCNEHMIRNSLFKHLAESEYRNSYLGSFPGGHWLRYRLNPKVWTCKRLERHVPSQRLFQQKITSSPENIGAVVFLYVFLKVKSLILVQAHLQARLTGLVAQDEANLLCSQ